VKGLVLDASALLAVFFEETGAEVVAPVLFGASVSAVNYSEVIKKVLERRGNFELTRNFLNRQSLRIVAFDTARATRRADIQQQWHGSTTLLYKAHSLPASLRVSCD